MTGAHNQTRDGRPVSPIPPHGAMIVVFRDAGPHLEYLLLHRKHHGSDDEGPWAWGPPSGARYPGEDIDHCAARELREETGLRGKPHPLQGSGQDWPTYVLQVTLDAQPRLSEEHDQWCRVSAEEATPRIEPRVVRDAFSYAVRVLQQD